ncbi:MAG: hypothetical protein Q8P26_03650 [Candidatus Levybacteria bacterium]|nr:hypothetical protein [Candidatus Levybacteria bacterium]
MIEVAEIKTHTEQQIRQSLLRDLFKTASEKALSLKEKDAPTYRGELVNGILADGITIRSLHARLEQNSLAPLIEIRSPNDKSAAEVIFIGAEEFGIGLTIWKMRRKGLMPKSTYNFIFTGSGEKYQRFLDKNHDNHFDIRSSEDIRKLTSNIRNWEKV